MHKLTIRQKKFVEAYLEFGNAIKAAEFAGYSKGYAENVKRQPAVKKYLAELRSQLPMNLHAEVVNFLTKVMRGEIEASTLQTKAAYQLGLRAGLWNNKHQCSKMIKEVGNE